MTAPRVRSDHTFHIPVMGTGFTIDTPLRVARYGIASVISLVDDVLIEQARRHHCGELGEPYEAITNDHPDPRAARITAYLDLLDRVVRRQSEALRSAPIEPGSEIHRYYELLPETPLKRLFRRYMDSRDEAEKSAIECQLRENAVPGAIDANIMTKVDANNFRDGVEQPAEFADAMAALRGFAQSTVNASIVLSAGINHRLYAYIAEFADFHPEPDGSLRKRITLKVSDYRSAQIQGRFLAKSGLWVSEFRVESGINCGGHTFPTAGYLLGPILEEFKQKRGELLETLHTAINRGRKSRGLPLLAEPPELRVTVQGGIGNASENELLLKYYQMDGTGWGTPFLMAPDVVNIDEEHCRKMIEARPGDVRLSDSSPLGVPFWNLMTSASEEKRRRHIEEGRPGSACPKGYLRFETRFGLPPLCLASRQLQKQAMNEPPPAGESPEVTELKREALQHKSCICHDLGGGFLRRHGIAPRAAPAICCGPNILYFKRLTTLDELIGQIYGRISNLCATDRPHMLIQELRLYIAHLKEQIESCSKGLIDRTPKYFDEFVAHLSEGIRYYRELSRQIVSEQRERFLDELGVAQNQLETVMVSTPGSYPGQTG